VHDADQRLKARGAKRSAARGGRGHASASTRRGPGRPPRGCSLSSARALRRNGRLRSQVNRSRGRALARVLRSRSGPPTTTTTTLAESESSSAGSDAEERDEGSVEEASLPPSTRQSLSSTSLAFYRRNTNPVRFKAGAGSLQRKIGALGGLRTHEDAANVKPARSISKDKSRGEVVRDAMKRVLVVSLPRLADATSTKPDCKGEIDERTDVVGPEEKCPAPDENDTYRCDESPAESIGWKWHITEGEKARSKKQRKDDPTSTESRPDSQGIVAGAGKFSQSRHSSGHRFARDRPRQWLRKTTNCDESRNKLSLESASSRLGERGPGDRIQRKKRNSDVSGVSRTAAAREAVSDSDVEVTDPARDTSSFSDAVDFRTIDLTTPPPGVEVHEISDSDSTESVVEVEDVDGDDSDDIVWIVENGSSASSLATGGSSSSSGGGGVIDLTSSRDKLTLAIVDGPSHVGALSSSSAVGRMNVGVRASSNPRENLIDLTRGEMVVSAVFSASELSQWLTAAVPLAFRR
jgi:hypothetical protein